MNTFTYFFNYLFKKQIIIPKDNDTKDIKDTKDNQKYVFDNLPKYIIFWVCEYLSEEDLNNLKQYNVRYKRIVGDEYPIWKKQYSHLLYNSI